MSGRPSGTRLQDTQQCRGGGLASVALEVEGSSLFLQWQDCLEARNHVIPGDSNSPTGRHLEGSWGMDVDRVENSNQILGTPRTSYLKRRAVTDALSSVGSTFKTSPTVQPFLPTSPSVSTVQAAQVIANPQAFHPLLHHSLSIFPHRSQKMLAPAPNLLVASTTLQRNPKSSRGTQARHSVTSHDLIQALFQHHPLN